MVSKRGDLTGRKALYSASRVRSLALAISLKPCAWVIFAWRMHQPRVAFLFSKQSQVSGNDLIRLEVFRHVKCL